MDNHKKHSLGSRAFTFFLLKRIKIAAFLFILAGALWYSAQWLPEYYLMWSEYAAKLIGLLGGAYFVLMFAITYLEYRFYTFMFTEEAFIMTFGYITRKEVAAVYHQIQNVNINRGPLDRLTGVSQMVIFMTGAEREPGHNKIVLPTIGKAKAKLVQKELLMRARRHVVAPQSIPTEEGINMGLR